MNEVLRRLSPAIARLGGVEAWTRKTARPGHIGRPAGLLLARAEIECPPEGTAHATLAHARQRAAAAAHFGLGEIPTDAEAAVAGRP